MLLTFSPEIALSAENLVGSEGAEKIKEIGKFPRGGNSDFRQTPDVYCY
jgi:hypothetical protein